MSALATQARQIIQSSQTQVLTDIYQADVNMAVWQRKLSCAVKHDANYLLSRGLDLKHTVIIQDSQIHAQVAKLFQEQDKVPDIVLDITRLVDMFCTLFGLKAVGLRLTKLNCAMCPKCHVDHVPCRLVTTYHGSATQYLPYPIMDKKQANWKAHEPHLKQLQCGDVALLKGENWPENENFGIVHRSPSMLDGEHRLLLTLDFTS